MPNISSIPGSLYNSRRAHPIEIVGAPLSKLQGSYDPMHIAVREGSIDTVKLLIDSGADLNAEALYGYTPLQVALDMGDLEIVELLIKKLKASDHSLSKLDAFESKPVHIAMSVVCLLKQQMAERLINASERSYKKDS